MLGPLNMLKVPALAAPQLAPCASSGCAWTAPCSSVLPQSEAQPLGAPPSPRLPELAASQVADSTAFNHAGLWATAYYTHRVIVGSGEITPASNQRRSSFQADTSYTEHVCKALRQTIGSVKPEAEGALSFRRSPRKSTKIQPAPHPSPEMIAAAATAAAAAEIAAHAAFAAAPVAAPAAAPAVEGGESSFGSSFGRSPAAAEPQARSGTCMRSVASLSANSSLQPSRTAAQDAWRRARAGTIDLNKALKEGVTFNRGSERVSNRASGRASARRAKRRGSVSADKTAMKASNTIYDIVSLTKQEIFPTEHFGTPN